MSVLTFKSMSGAVLIAAVLSVPGFVQLAEARGGGFGGGFGGFHGGGGFHDDGGFSGGSFRGDSGVAVGPEGGVVARGPDGGVAARGPEGGAVVRGPDGGVAARGPEGGVVAVGPDGGVAARSPENAYGDYYYGGGGEYNYAGAAAGAAATFAVGTAVAALSPAATMEDLAGQTYYLDDGIYYQPCYQGAAENYCVVSPP